MARAFTELSVVIPNGGTVSSPVLIRDADTLALYIPTVTSGTLGLDVSYDATSANFVPLHAPGSAGAFSYPVAAGGISMALTGLVAGFPYMRLRAQNAQGAERTFRLFVRR